MNKICKHILLLALLLIGVVETNAQDVYYQKITSKAQLVDGAHIIIVCEEQNLAMGEFEEYDKDIRSKKIEVGINNGLIAYKSGFNELTYLPSTQGVRLKGTANGYSSCYMHAGHNNNNNNNKKTYLKMDTGGVGNESNNWNISFDSDGNVQMYTNADEERYLMYDSGNKYFTYATNTYYGKIVANILYSKIQLYKKVDKVSLSEKVNAYGTYYTNYAYQLPNEVDGYAIYHEAIEGEAITPVLAYKGGSMVPANTALLLKAEAAGDYYLMRLDDKTGISQAEGIENNCLEGTRNAEGIATSKRENVYYYKLTTKDGVRPGFYWGATDGVAFQLQKATTAYLAIPQSVSASQALRLDLTTSVENLPVNGSNHTSNIFTLSGVRVSKRAEELPKGIYIIDGKKVMVK